jgi:hypothetical protein
VRSLDRWLFAPGTAHRLAAMRAGMAVVIALRLATGPYAQLAGQPAALFLPPDFLSWLPGMPSAGVMVALQVIGTAAAVAVLARWKPRLAFVLAWACLLVLAGLRGSLGKILHNDVLVLLASVPLLLAPAARWRDRTRSALYGWPVRSALVVLSVAYGFSALHKLATSGLDWITGDNMRWILYQAAASGRAPTRDLALFVADRPALAHLAAAGVVAFELLFPLVLVFRRARAVLLGAAIAFHTGTWLTLGLDYWGWMLTDLVVLLDWDSIDAWLEARRRPDLAPTAPAPSRA